MQIILFTIVVPLIGLAIGCAFIVIGRRKGSEGRFSFSEFAFKTRTVGGSSGPQMIGEGIIMLVAAIVWLVMSRLFLSRQ